MIENLEIIKMDESHIEKIALIEKQNFSKPWSKQSLKEELTNNTAYFLVAKNKTNVYGYIGMHIIKDEAYIANIAIDKAYQNKKIGTKLLNYVLKFGKENNLNFITLEVRTSNLIARKFYKSMGFKQVGIRKNFYNDPKEDAKILTYYFKED